MPDWDKIFRGEGRVFLAPHPEMKRLADVFRTRDVKRVLDLGCGTGRHMVFFSAEGFEMYGIDASEYALELARSWLDEQGLHGVLIPQRMELKFPFEDGFFDAVISIQAIHHNKISDILATIREARRVLRKGGVIFVTVSIMTERGVSSSNKWDFVEIEPGTYLPQKGRESGILHHYFTPDELRSAFSGFDILEMFIDSTNHRCLLAIKD